MVRLRFNGFLCRALWVTTERDATSALVWAVILRMGGGHNRDL